jgi:5-methyltetrahydrofolate--homocysteine methyltransferase
MDRLVELSRSGEDDPDFGTVVGGRDLGPRRSEMRKLAAAEARERGEELPARSPEVVTDNPVFVPPFVGSRVAKGMSVDDVATYLNETALFRNQWGFRPESGEDDPSFKERVRRLLREQLATAKAEQLLVPQVAWGHFAANADGDELVIFKDDSRSSELMRFSFPRQTEEPWLCISDFFRSVASGEPDWASFQVVTMGSRVSEEAARLFAEDEYQQYLYLHGLGVEMAEALAEYWHRRIREELGFAEEDGPTLTGVAGTRGATRRARTSRTTPRWSTCSAPTGSVWWSARVSNCIPNSRRRRSSATTPRPSTSWPRQTRARSHAIALERPASGNRSTAGELGAAHIPDQYHG